MRHRVANRDFPFRFMIAHHEQIGEASPDLGFRPDAVGFTGGGPFEELGQVVFLLVPCLSTAEQN